MVRLSPTTTLSIYFPPDLETLNTFEDVDLIHTHAMHDTDSDSAVLWEHRFSDLLAWKSTHGSCNVPKAEGKLGRWVVRQRELHKKGKLDSSRRTRLSAEGFVWNTNEAAWEQKRSLLAAYGTRHGHVCVPISDAVLGMWVAKMRANRRRGKLAQHRIDKLDALRFVWNTAEEEWLQKYARLKAYRARHGHSCVPFNEGELGWWVNTQRQNKRKGKLASHRERLLDEADFVWKPQEFLAARRRSQAAQRAALAHRLASAHAPPAYVLPTLQPLGVVPVPKFAASAEYAAPPRKRRYQSLEGDGPVLSPVSVKRPKLTNLPSDRPSAPAWPVSAGSPSTETDSTSEARVAYRRSSGHSISTLLCAAAQSAQSAQSTQRGGQPEGPSPRFGDPTSKLDLLSSVCVLPRVSELVAQRKNPASAGMLPPISSLHKLLDASASSVTL